ncbi:MAG: hypothetical protein HY755_02040 [Nitrospirae bacterium]|nr:hypothetical protein [Nitrospirota bacterium]
MSAPKILGWVERELKKNRNDTTHNSLAYLAEQGDSIKCRSAIAQKCEKRR